MKYLQATIPIIFAALSIITLLACQEKALYKKTFSEAEKIKLANQMTTDLIKKYNQGTVSEIMVLEEAIKLAPEEAGLWREIGVPYGKRGLAVEFQENYSKAVQYDPLNWQGWRGYMYLYFYRDYERAIKDFDTLDDLTPGIVDYPQSTSIHFMRAICYLQLEEYEKAITYWDKHFEEELRTGTEDYIDPRAYLFQGITYLKMGDLENANRSFEKGIKNHPKNADLWLWSAKLAFKNGALAKGKKALNNAQVQFNKNYQNARPYVEEFYQMHQSDIDELK